MPIDPRLAPLVSQAPSTSSALSVQERRAAAHAGFEAVILPLTGEAPELHDVLDFLVTVADGEIPVRLYRPNADPCLPVHIYLHGGAFWIGTIDLFDALCRRMARDAGCAVLSVGYRLAPEHTFPTQPHDCFAALRWLVEGAEELGIDADRISVGGASAGANLAAAVTLMVKDHGGPPLVGQVLEIPLTTLLIGEEDLDLIPSDGPPQDLNAGQEIRDLYLSDLDDASHPHASPLLAADLSDLPPALVMTAEYDLVTPSADRYAQRLIAAGVRVTQKRWLGQTHGTQHFEKVIPDAAHAYHQMVVDFLLHCHGTYEVVKHSKP